MKSRALLFATYALASAGCGNAYMKEVNPNGGTITLYGATGTIIQSFKTDGKPMMHDGGHIYCRERDTKKLVIVYGTFTFVEDDDQK